jgi:pyruvate dehydrogenase E2 component (dihydrolipoamide acetyltransferase)
MPTPVIMPALGMAQETGKLLRWHRAEGEAVKKGEPLFEVETDKVTVDVDAPVDGTLAGVRAAEGDEVPVGEPVAVVLAAGEELPAESEPRVTREAEALAAPPASNKVLLGSARTRRGPLASPKARRLAAARGIDIEALRGSGPNGAVVAADVEAWQPVAEPSNKVLLAAAAATEPSSIWRVMAQRTTESWQTVPHFYLRRRAPRRAGSRSRPPTCSSASQRRRCAVIRA